MKKFNFLSVLLVVSTLCLGFVSCSGDDDNDEPTPVDVENDVDYSTIISAHWINIGLASNLEQTLSIDTKDGSISMQDLVNDGGVQWGALANGTFTLTSNVIKAVYNDVTVFNSNFDYGTYHGFTHSKTRSVTYTIQSCDGKRLVIKDDGGLTSTFEKYADMK